MASFPSAIERTVASALLLLSTPPSKLISCYDGERKGKTNMNEASSFDSNQCTSSVTTDQLSSRKKKLRIISAVVGIGCHEIKLKVMKKRRSRIYRSYGDWEISSKTSSCLSGNSGIIPSARSQRKTTKAEKTKAAKQRKRRGGGACTLIRSRAEAVLNLLAGGCFSEGTIRQVLGDSPDTSKALRMLLKQEEVKRSGIGGPKDPFIYTIA